MLLLAENRLSDASPYFEKASALDPKYALPHYQLGRLLARSQRFREARSELEQAIALQPDLTEAYHQLAHAYERLGEKQKAEQALARFQQHKNVEYNERQDFLKQAHEALQDKP